MVKFRTRLLLAATCSLSLTACPLDLPLDPDRPDLGASPSPGASAAAGGSPGPGVAPRASARPGRGPIPAGQPSPGDGEPGADDGEPGPDDAEPGADDGGTSPAAGGAASAWDAARGAEVALYAGTSAAVEYGDGPADKAIFHNATDFAADAEGNLYVADGGNHVIRLITPARVVSTLAGVYDRPFEVPEGKSVFEGDIVTFRDGPRASAIFGTPSRLTLDAAGNVWVVDGSRIRVVNRKSGNVTTALGGVGDVGGLAVGPTGAVYFTEVDQAVIKKIDLSDPRSPVASVFAGVPGEKAHQDGDAGVARFKYPTRLAFDAAGDLYVTDASRVRKIAIDGEAAEVTTLAGSGAGMPKFNTVVGKEPIPDNFDGADGLDAQLGGASAMAVAPDGVVYVVTGYNTWGCIDGDCFDSDHWQIRQVKPDGSVSTIVDCDDPDGTKRKSLVPIAMRATAEGLLFVLSADFAGTKLFVLRPKP